MPAHHAARRGAAATGRACARTAAAPPPRGRRGSGPATGRRRRRRSAGRSPARRGRAAGRRACPNDDAGVIFAARRRSRRRGGARRRTGGGAGTTPGHGPRDAVRRANPTVRRSYSRPGPLGDRLPCWSSRRWGWGAPPQDRQGGCSDCRGRRRPGAAGASSTSACGRGRQVAPALVLCCAAAHEPARGPGRRRPRAPGLFLLLAQGAALEHDGEPHDGDESHL